MRKAFTGLAIVLLLAVAVQFFLAASGAFNSAPNDESFGLHRALGLGIVPFAVLVTIFAVPARMPGRVIGMTGLVVGLGILQPVIAGVSNAVGDTGGAGPLVFGLHGINGLIMMGVAGAVVGKARELSSAPAPASTAP